MLEIFCWNFGVVGVLLEKFWVGFWGFCLTFFVYEKFCLGFVVIMVKQKVQKSWLQKTKSQRQAKSLTDARLLLKHVRAKTSYSEYVCSLCENKGALLACIKCLKLFHLSCLNLHPLQIPLSQWPCPDCLSSYNLSFLDSLQTFIETQSQEKEAKLRKLTKKMNKANPNTKLKDFEAKYPDLVKYGQIQYPIEDSILWSKPKLHELTFQSFPPAQTSPIPSHILTDLLFICDFCHCFQNLLSTPSLKCETLYTNLQLTHETALSRNLHISLFKPIVIILLKSESFRKKGPILNYLVYKIKKKVGFERLLEYSYLTFIENLFATDTWKELIEEIDEETWLGFQEFSFTDNYYGLPVEYKIKLLVLCIGMLLETKIINEECNRRHEAQMKIVKEKVDLACLVRSKKNAGVDKDEVEMKIKELEREVKKYPTRTASIGSDRIHKEYFFFPWDASKLYIKSSDHISREQYSWSYYDKLPDLTQFLECLSQKGIRESHLHTELSSIISSSDFHFSELETTSSDTEEERNKHKETVNNLNTLKSCMIYLHNSVSESLRLPINQIYLKEIEDCSDSLSIIPSILTFHQSFIFCESEENLKYCRKIRNLWENCELYLTWETALKECRNVSEVFICLHYLTLMVEKFNVENRVIVKDSNRNENRRSFRLEKLNKVKKTVLKEQDVHCYICGQLGLVACCDRCPKVAHLECLGVEDLPEGEWLCPICIEKISNIRVTRSSKLNFNL